MYKLRMTSTLENSRYSHVAIVLHWTMALLIIGMLAAGKFMTSLSEDDPLRFSLTQWHKSFGLCILFLTVVRILWRTTHRAPALPVKMRRWERVAAHCSHWAFYLLMIAMPVSGWLLVSASPLNISTYLFDLIRIPHLPWVSTAPDRDALTEQFLNFHHYASMVLIVLLILHVTAALRHQLVLRDDIFRRMRPDLTDGSFADGMRLSGGFLVALVGSILLFQAAGRHDTATRTDSDNPSETKAESTAPGNDNSADDPAAWPSAEVSYSVVVMNGKLTGQFPDAKAYAFIDLSDPQTSILRAVVNTATSNARNPQIDDALPAAGWFDSLRFPEASFYSSRMTSQSDNEWLVEGDLTIRDTTKPVTFTLTTDNNGYASGEFGINRLDYNVGATEQPDGKIAAIDVIIRFNVPLVSK